ncbi:hypothetical protein HDU96_001595, partial [Phlyctochytrium bullatum]
MAPSTARPAVPGFNGDDAVIEYFAVLVHGDNGAVLPQLLAAVSRETLLADRFWIFAGYAADGSLLPSRSLVPSSFRFVFPRPDSNDGVPAEWIDLPGQRRRRGATDRKAFFDHLFPYGTADIAELLPFRQLLTEGPWPPTLSGTGPFVAELVPLNHAATLLAHCLALPWHTPQPWIGPYLGGLLCTGSPPCLFFSATFAEGRRWFWLSATINLLADTDEEIAQVTVQLLTAFRLSADGFFVKEGPLVTLAQVVEWFHPASVAHGLPPLGSLSEFLDFAAPFATVESSYVPFGEFSRPDFDGELFSLARLPSEPSRPLRTTSAVAGAPSPVAPSSAGLAYLSVVQLQHLNSLAQDAYSLTHPAPETPPGAAVMAITPYNLRSRALPSLRVRPLNLSPLAAVSAGQDFESFDGLENFSKLSARETAITHPVSPNSDLSLADPAPTAANQATEIVDSRVFATAVPGTSVSLMVPPVPGQITYYISFPGLFTMSAKEARERIKEHRLISTEPRDVWHFFYGLKSQLEAYVTPAPPLVPSGTTTATTSPAAAVVPRAFANLTEAFLHTRTDKWFLELPSTVRTMYWKVVQPLTSWDHFADWIWAK